MLVDDLVRAEFSRSTEHARELLPSLIARASEPVDAAQIAELLLEAKGPHELLEAAALEGVPAPIQLEVLLHLAWLYAEQGDDERTLTASTRALALEPADERALAIAEPLLLEGQAFAQLANHYAEAAMAAGTEERAKQLLERAMHMLRDTPSAAPALLSLTERLSQLHRLREKDDSLLAVLKHGGADASAALLKLGERWLAEGRARDGVEALPQDLSVFRSEASLDLLERLFDQAEELDRLARVLRTRADAAATPVARGRGLEKLATFLHERLGDQVSAAGALLAAATAFTHAGELDDAERAYERLLEILPEHVNAAAQLVTLRAKAGNFSGVVEAFGVVLGAEGDAKPAAELLLSIAPDAERACAADEMAELSESVQWRLSPEQREVEAQLLRMSARLFAAQARYDEAADSFRRLIADRAAETDLRAFQALIDESPDRDWRQTQQRWLFEWQGHHSADRPSVLLEWARFEETEGGDPAAAADVLWCAAELSPERGEIWEELLRLRLAAGDGAASLAAAEELRRLGRELPPALLEALLEHAPSARWIVDRLKLGLSAESRWAELFELYDRAIATAPAEERRGWLEEAAVAARDVAQDRARAVGYWQALLELAPQEARADLALERLYEQLGQRRELIAHLTRRLDGCAPEQRASIRERIIGSALELGALNIALETIDRDAANATALLERVFARSADIWTDATARAAGQEAAATLRGHYAEQGAFEDVVRLLRAELALPLGQVERRERLNELSRICERELGDDAAALEAARSAFLLTLGGREQKRLEKLTKKRGAWRELCNTYESASDSELNADARRALLRRAADLATESLRDEGAALGYWQQLFELEPASARDVYDALGDGGAAPFEALCRVLTRGRRFEELEQVLLERARSSPEPTLFSQLGRLRADELKAPLAAIDAHLQADDARAAAEVFLRQPSVFGAETARALSLASRLNDVGLPEASRRVLAHQLAYFGEQFPVERKPVQLELIRLLEAAGEREQANAVLTEAAKRYPTDAEVQRAGADAATARKEWERAEQCYRTLLLLLHGSDSSTVSLRRATVYVELAAIKQHRKDEAASTQLVESGFEAALDDPGELMALVRSLLQHDMWSEAERATSELLSRDRSLEADAVVLDAIGQLRRSGRTVQQELLDRASGLAESLVARWGQLAALERAAALQTCVAFLPLAEAELLLLRAKEEPSASISACRLELGRRWLETEDEAGQTKAIEHLQALVSHPDAPVAAWELLARAWEATGNEKQLGAVLDSWLQRHPRSPDVAARALTLALAGDDADRALTLHDALVASSAAPSPEQSLALCALCTRAGKRERAVQLLRAEAGRETKPLKRAALLTEAGGLLAEAGELDAAVQAAKEAQVADSGSAEATLLLAQLLLRQGQRAEAAEQLERYVSGKERRRGKPLSRLLRLAADLRLEKDELGEALPLLIEAHQLDKTDLDTALLLGLLAIDLDRLETATSALRALIAQRELGTREGSGPRSADFAQAYLQLARIDHHQGKKTNAKRMAQRALEENPELTSAKQLLGELQLH